MCLESLGIFGNLWESLGILGIVGIVLSSSIAVLNLLQVFLDCLEFPKCFFVFLLRVWDLRIAWNSRGILGIVPLLRVVVAHLPKANRPFDLLVSPVWPIFSHGNPKGIPFAKAESQDPVAGLDPFPG